MNPNNPDYQTIRRKAELEEAYQAGRASAQQNQTNIQAAAGIKTPWGETGQSGQGVTNLTMPTPPLKPKPDSVISPSLPYAPSVYMTPEQSYANLHHGQLQIADNYWREAIRHYNMAIFQFELNRFYGHPAVEPNFAVSLATATAGRPTEGLPWAEVQELYEIPPSPVQKRTDEIYQSRIKELEEQVEILRSIVNSVPEPAPAPPPSNPYPQAYPPGAGGLTPR